MNPSDKVRDLYYFIGILVGLITIIKVIIPFVKWFYKKLVNIYIRILHKDNLFKKDKRSKTIVFPEYHNDH